MVLNNLYCIIIPLEPFTPLIFIKGTWTGGGAVKETKSAELKASMHLGLDFGQLNHSRQYRLDVHIKNDIETYMYIKLLIKLRIAYVCRNWYMYIKIGVYKSRFYIYIKFRLNTEDHQNHTCMYKIIFIKIICIQGCHRIKISDYIRIKIRDIYIKIRCTPVQRILMYGHT